MLRVKQESGALIFCRSKSHTLSQMIAGDSKSPLHRNTSKCKLDQKKSNKQRNLTLLLRDLYTSNKALHCNHRSLHDRLKDDLYSEQ